MYKGPFFRENALVDRRLTKKNTYLRHFQERHYFGDFFLSQKKEVDIFFFSEKITSNGME